MDIVTSRSEVIEELITRVKQGDVNASIQPGTPLYDLLVYRFADVITDERELINILTNVARVSPMFGDDGRLLDEYADMDTFLTDRFFLAKPEDNAVYDTLYLRFSDQAGLNVLPGSRVWYGSLQLDVRPTYIPYDSQLWKPVMVNDRKLYEHPVEINIRLDTDEYIPATDSWITGDVKIKTDKFMFVLGARSTKSVSSVVTPKVTLEYLRSSISNRSLSNPRAILYNLRSNLGFSPDQLVKAAVLPVSDRCLIERRKVLFQDDTTAEPGQNPGRTASDFRTLTAIVGGDAKVMLDYGTALYKAPVKAVVLDRSDPLYSELNPLICRVNPYESVTELNVSNAEEVSGHVTLSAPEPASVYAPSLTGMVRILTADITAKAVTVTDGIAATITKHLVGTATVTGPASGSFRLWLYDASDSPTATRKVCGWLAYTLDTELLHAQAESSMPDAGTILVSETFEYYRNNYLLFRIDTSGLGFLSPVSVGTEADLDAVKAILESSNPDDLLLPGTTASASAPGTSLRIHHGSYQLMESACFRLSNPEVAGNALLRTAAPRIYWKVVTSATAGGEYYIVLSTDPEYVSDPIGIYKIARPPESSAVDYWTADFALDTNLTLRVKYNVNALIEWENTYNNLKEQYFTVPEVFIRNSNRYLVFAMNPDGSSTVQDFDTWLLYYGTDPELMAKAQELFLNRRLAEVGTRIMVSPFRPVVFTAYWGKDYVAQYIPVEDPEDETRRYDEIRSKFVDLLAWLENYMSSYSGKISDIDFAAVVADGQNATGIQLKRLDWTLFTQRGYAVRGHLDINLDKECRIDWNKDVLETVTLQIDKDPAFIEEEKEMFVTDEKLYRPVFSRVGV